MGKESHYSSKKDRVFLRAIAGPYIPTSWFLQDIRD